MVLVCVLVTCLSVGTGAGLDPNQTPQRPDVNPVPQAAPSADANSALLKLSPPARSGNLGKNTFNRAQAVPWVIAGVAAIFGPVLGFVWAVYLHRRRVPETKLIETTKKSACAEFDRANRQQESLTLEDDYRKMLAEKLGWVQMLGSPDIPNLPVHLLDTFVSLRISETWRSESRFDPEAQTRQQERDQDFTPEQIAQRAFSDRRILVIIGDPGSGKTTLLKYYAMCCLSPDGWRKLGFAEAPLPAYYPLGRIRSLDQLPKSLAECLASWACEHETPIPRETFDEWLRTKPTLVLLDALDEIRDRDLRRAVCQWIDNTVTGLDKAKFVVTSRWTGYRKTEGIEIAFPHVRADIKEFSTEQQATFLRKWFCAAFLEQRRDDNVARQEWEEQQKERGLQSAQKIIDFLGTPRNKAVCELAGVPMLLQIIATIWKEREILPRDRADLYEVALKYLLQYRDEHKKLAPRLPARMALRVLLPVALWMQEQLQVDEADRQQFHEQVQAVITTMDQTLTGEEFCADMRDRAGLIADYGEKTYVFRHKSFREYLAGVELVDICKDPKRLKQIAEHLGDDWWEEPLRFFMAEVDDSLFDGFMDAIFRSDVSKELDQKTYNLLLTLVGEASQRRITSLVKRLNDKRLYENKQRYIVDCLRTVGSDAAWTAIKEFARNHPATSAGRFAKGLVAQKFVEPVLIRDYSATVDLFKNLPPSFLRPSEVNAAYIHIRGGTFRYPVDGTTASIPDLYFAEYPVTNKRYRRFIDYLAGRRSAMNEILSFDVFAQELLEFARQDDALAAYLTNDPQLWNQKLRSSYDEEKRFNGDDQPVVGVSWFEAQAYCFWLSSFETASQELTGGRRRRVYRLPSEVEWVWAAFGRGPGGGLREYPWLAEKGSPSDKLANYAGNVGATTPVGRYPDGATPEGLMDMAGNVWEWMENWHEEYKERARSLRGGSWLNYELYLGRSGRYYGNPDFRNDYVGFRVVCSQS